MSNYTLMQLKQNSTPEAFGRHLREMGELFWWEPGKFWVVTSYSLAKQVLTCEAYSCDRSPFFISRMPEMNLALITDFFKVVSKMMVMSDAPVHTDRRRICYHGFSSQCLTNLQPIITRSVQTCLSTFQPNQPFDFVREVAEVIPSTTLAELFAIPESERRDFYQWSNNMTQFFGGSTSYQNEDGIKVNHSAQQLYAYFAELLQQRRHHPQDDFLSTLIAHQSHFKLSDDDIISQAIMMLVAGQVSTTDQLCNNLFTLLSTPGVWQELANDLTLLDSYIEECNRLDPAVTFLFRVTKQETELAGQHIPIGSVIFLSTHAINRDPQFFASPDVISINKSQHMGFGYDSHFCLGAKLARMEMHSVFKALLQQFPSLSLDPTNPAIRKHHSLSFSGFEKLNIV